MIHDTELVFSDAQDETSVAAHASDNIIDLTTAGDAIDSLWLVVAVQTTVTSEGNATVTYALQTDSDSAFGTAETLLATGRHRKGEPHGRHPGDPVADPHGVQAVPPGALHHRHGRPDRREIRRLSGQRHRQAELIPCSAGA